MGEDARMEGKSREQLVEEVGRLRSEVEALGLVEAERRRMEEPFQKKNGERLWAEVNGTPVLRDGELRHYLANWVDVTDRKRAEEELETSRQELRELAEHLQSAREEERTGIAREIHDDLGLTAAIQWYAGEFEQRAGAKCEVSVEREVIVLEQDRSTAVFRIFQEALTNVARHAAATRVRVNLGETDGKLVLEIADDGKGITARQISGRKSFGLMGMRESAAFLGGELQISGGQDKGMRVTVSIPLRREGRSTSP